MSMDRQNGSGLQGIEHPLRLIVRRVAEVEVHSEPGRGLGLGGEIIEELLVDNQCEVEIDDK